MKYLPILAIALVLSIAGRAWGALPCNGVWTGPYTYQATQGDAIAGNLGPITVSGTVVEQLAVTCVGSFHMNVQALAGCADSITPGSKTCPAGGPTDFFAYPFVVTNQFIANQTETFTVPIDTTKLQNGLHDVGCQQIDSASGKGDGACNTATGVLNQTGGTDGDLVFNVQNGGAPPPTATPTSQPTSSASGPNGVAPPAGFQWVQTYSENFTTESDINHNVWSAAQNYTMSGANGVAVQGSPTNPTSPGSTGYLVNTNNSINQRYGFWQWVAKYPHNDSGEGAGYHSDLYLGDSTTVPYMEDDICEWDTAFTGATSCGNFISESAGTDEYSAQVPNGGSGSPPIGDAFHTWGVYWHNDGTPQGTVQDWFDGVAQPGTYTLTNSNWALGMRPLIINDSCGTGNCSSASNNPLYIQSFQIWQLEAVSGTPTPTVAPTSTPTSTATPSPNCSEITTSGPTLTDQNGNRWSFSSTFQALENGAVFGGSGPNLTDMTLSGGAIYVFYPPTSTWYVSSPAGTGWNNGQSAGPSCGAPTPTPAATPTPSPNCTEITTSGPTIRDGNGNAWAFNSSFQATENGSVFDNSGANLTEMVYSSGSIAVGWQNSKWWFSTPAGANFSNETNTAPCSGVPLAATFLDNNTLTPSGAPESHVQISGLTESTIASMTITGTGVAADDWVYPANGTNLVPTIQMDGNGIADVWFQWVAHAPSYVIAVGYADGTGQVSDPEIPDPGQTFNVDRIDLPQIHKSLGSPPGTHSEIRIQGDNATWTFSVPNKTNLN